MVWTCEQLAGLELGLSFLVDFRDRRPAAAPMGQEALSKFHDTSPRGKSHIRVYWRGANSSPLKAAALLVIMITAMASITYTEDVLAMVGYGAKDCTCNSSANPDNSVEQGVFFISSLQVRKLSL